ncbi:MAG TPA: M36 family metallopeptidase [Candidatus Binatia bacterium]
MSCLLPVAAGAAAPSFDARNAAAPHAARQLSASQQDLIRPGSRVSFDDRFGIPDFVWTSASPPAESAARRARARSPEREARSHLRKLASLYGLDEADVLAARVSQVHDTGDGGVIVKFREQVDGVDVFQEEASVLMDRNLERVAVSGFLGGTRSHAPSSIASGFALSAADAIAIAIADRTGDSSVTASDLVAQPGTGGSYLPYSVPPGSRLAAVLPHPARAKPVYFHVDDSYRPAWYVEVSADVRGSNGQVDNATVATVVAADDGELLLRTSLSRSDSFSYRAWADTSGEHGPLDGPYTDGTPHPTGTPFTYTPSFTAPSLVSLAHGPISTNDAWLAPGSTVTKGNNVDAYTDASAPDGFSAGDFRADVTSPGSFDYTYDTAQDPEATSNQTSAAIVEAFYVANFEHDLYYDRGFDEAAGNGQQDNFGRGGLGGDPMLVEAQDYSGRDNADMNTPGDGFSPRMQLYLWDGPRTDSVAVDSQPSPHVLPSSLSPLGSADFGDNNTSVTADVVLVDDGVSSNSDGCDTPFANAESVAGKIALIDRGLCLFIDKVQNALAAGAVGVLIANNTGGGTVSGMSGPCNGPCSIPVLMITQNQGAQTKQALAAGTVGVTMSLQSGVDRDGALDNQIVAHEWAHFLSGRLVGDGSGLSSNQSGGLGEGWSDFNAMLMTVRDGDNWAGAYPMSAYASAGLVGDSAYFGLRRFPYSTDLTKNPLTFHDIQDGVAISGAPCSFDCDGANNSEVHDTGEVWTTMLWECYAALLGDTLGATPRLTFDEARTRMLGYLVASLKMTPLNPTFTEARDAVLASADASDLADEELFCNAFAKRGIGQGAVSPARFSSTNDGVVESFTCVPPAVCPSSPRGDCQISPRGQVKMQGSTLDPSRQSFSWKWTNGSTDLSDFGAAATGGTNYRLCVYDDDSLVMNVALPGGGSCNGRPCWSSGSSGLRYKFSGGNPGGLTQVTMKPGSGRAQVQVKGKGEGLALPFPISDTSAVAVQLVEDANSGGNCWSTQFASPAVTLDPTTLKYQDKIP